MSSDDLRKEAEHDTELAKEREERQKRARTELHAAAVKREIRELEFARDRAKRELDGLSYETSSLEHAIRAGSHVSHQGSTTVEAQKATVGDLKDRLERLKREERTGQSKVREQERLLTRDRSATERDGREETATLEHLRDQLADTLTELGTLARERDTLSRSSHSEDVGSRSKKESEERAIERLTSEKERLAAQDQREQALEAEIRRALISDKREVTRIVAPPENHAYDREARTDRTAIETLRREIATDEAEVRMLMERIKEKQTRLRALEVKLANVEEKMRSRRDTTHKTGVSTNERKVAHDEEELERLTAEHTEVTGRIRELESEIEEHETLLMSLSRSTERTSSSRSTSLSTLEKKIRDAERSRDLLQSQIRDAENRVNHRSSASVSREEEQLRSTKQETEQVVREEHDLEEQLRTAERTLERMTSEAERAASEEKRTEEHGRVAAQRKRVQDERKKKLSDTIVDLDRKIAAKTQEIS